MTTKRLLGLLCVKLAVIFMVTGILILLPNTENDDFLRYKNALVALYFVIAVGKTLFDSFYYERHPF